MSSRNHDKACEIPLLRSLLTSQIYQNKLALYDMSYKN